LSSYRRASPPRRNVMADIDVPDFAVKMVQIMAWAKNRCPDHGRGSGWDKFPRCFCAEISALLKNETGAESTQGDSR